MEFACDQCEYEAKTKGMLKIHHISLHQDLKYSCNTCGKSARRIYFESRGRLQEDEPTPPSSSEDELPGLKPAMRKSRQQKKKNLID